MIGILILAILFSAMGFILNILNLCVSQIPIVIITNIILMPINAVILVFGILNLIQKFS